MHGYIERIVTLYQTASSFIQQSLEMDNEDGGFFHHCPFFHYQVFVCASLIVLKIMRNGYFQLLLDLDAGKKLLNAAISALRKMSIANNDLPARLGDVISFFCPLLDYQALSGQGIDSLKLQVRNRLSMSIVYDSLWEWRKHFQAGGEASHGETHAPDESPVPCYVRIPPFRTN